MKHRVYHNLEYYPLVALARVPVDRGCARVPVDQVVPGCPASDKSRSPEVARLQAVAICLLVPQTVSPH